MFLFLVIPNINALQNKDLSIDQKKSLALQMLGDLNSLEQLLKNNPNHPDSGFLTLISQVKATVSKEISDLISNDNPNSSPPSAIVLPNVNALNNLNLSKEQKLALANKMLSDLNSTEQILINNPNHPNSNFLTLVLQVKAIVSKEISNLSVNNTNTSSPSGIPNVNALNDPSLSKEQKLVLASKMLTDLNSLEQTLKNNPNSPDAGLLPLILQTKAIVSKEISNLSSSNTNTLPSTAIVLPNIYALGDPNLSNEGKLALAKKMLADANSLEQTLKNNPNSQFLPLIQQLKVMLHQQINNLKEGKSIDNNSIQDDTKRTGEIFNEKIKKPLAVLEKITMNIDPKSRLFKEANVAFHKYESTLLKSLYNGSVDHKEEYKLARDFQALQGLARRHSYGRRAG